MPAACVEIMLNLQPGVRTTAVPRLTRDSSRATPDDYLVKYQYSGSKVYSGLKVTFCSLLDTASM